MTLEDTVLEIPAMLNLAPGPVRPAEAKTREWPAGTVVVSPDSHLLEDDCWFERFPPHLKDRAPRVGFKDGGWTFTIGGKEMLTPELSANLCQAMECRPGFSDIKARLKDLDIEGVHKELIYPQRLFGFYMFGDLDLREEIFSAYNAAIAERCAQGEGRLYPVMIPNYWDMSKAAASVERCAALGGRALMIPINPRTDEAGEPIRCNSPKMDPLWAAVERSGIPLVFHVGESLPTIDPTTLPLFTLVQLQGFRANWGALVFGGVFDRFPDLKVVFVEGGLSWVPSALHDADMIYHGYRLDPALKHAPSWYWRKNCYATFMTDPAGLQTLDRIGAETAMWASDYPHQESTLGYTRSAIDAVFDATPVEVAQQILGRTAMKVFNMAEPYAGPMPPAASSV